MKGVVSAPDCDLAERLSAALQEAHWEVIRLVVADAAVTDEQATLEQALAGADAVFLLDLRAGLPRSTQVARLHLLLTAALRSRVRRAVLLSDASVYAPLQAGAVTLRETDPIHSEQESLSERTRVALAMEQAFSNARDDGPERVILRIPTLYDRTDPRALDELRAVMLQGTASSRQEPLQRLHPADLCRAIIAAASLRAACGQVFNIAEQAAIAPETLEVELQRLGRLLSDPGATEDRVRPEYPLEQPLLATDKAARLLDFRPRYSCWVGLAECAQEIVFGLRSQGRVAENKPKLPAVIAALESRSKPLAGQLCVITGATSGIGRELAVILSRCGAHVVGVGRRHAAGAALMRELDERPSCTPGDFLAADLAEVTQVRALAANILSRFGQVDVLVNNAGAVFASRQMTAGGIEATFAVNYLAHFLLTSSLLGAIPGTGHILNLGSEIHRRSGLDFSDLFCARNYQPLDAYARAKFASMMFSNSLSEQLGPHGPRVATISPGMVRTEILNREELTERPELAAMNRGRSRMISAEKAATYVAGPLLEPVLAPLTGIYMEQDKQASITPATTDPQARARLWKVSQTLIEMV